jgi:hypothetical protein
MISFFAGKFLRSFAFFLLSLRPLLRGALGVESPHSSLDKKIPIIKQSDYLNKLREAAENSSLRESLAAYFSELLTPVYL